MNWMKKIDPVAILWVSLGALTTCLLVIALRLLFKTEVFSAKPISDEAMKDLWAFLGVALAAIGALIAALLTEQSSRRTAQVTDLASARETAAKDKDRALANESEARLARDQERQQLETTAKILELLTVNSEYAPRARVTGAIATLMDLRSGSIATRILGELWAEEKVSPATAVWLIDRVLTRGLEPAQHNAVSPAAPPSDADMVEASIQLFNNAKQCVPSSDGYQVVWPSVISDSWPGELPRGVKDILIAFAAKALLYRSLNDWLQSGNMAPVEMLYLAMDDRDKDLSNVVCKVLKYLDDVGVLEAWEGVYRRRPLPSDLREEIESDAARAAIPFWFEALCHKFQPWSEGKQPWADPQAPSITMNSATQLGDLDGEEESTIT